MFAFEVERREREMRREEKIGRNCILIELGLKRERERSKTSLFVYTISTMGGWEME